MGIKDLFKKKPFAAGKKNPVTTQPQQVQQTEQKSTIGCQYSYGYLIKGKTAMNVPSYKKVKAADPDKYADSVKADNAIINYKWIKSANMYEFFEAVTYSCIKGTRCSNGWAYWCGNKNNVTFENCVFESIKGLNIVGCKNVTIRNCIFEDSPTAIHLKNCTNVIIENCTIDCNTTGIFGMSAIYVGGGCNGVKIRNCKVISNGSAGKAFRFGNENMVNTDCSVDNCIADGSFASIGFVTGTCGTSEKPVTFSNITANLYNSKASCEPNRNAGGNYVQMYYCNGKSFATMKNCVTHMDIDRPRCSSRITTSGCTFDMTGKKN